MLSLFWALYWFKNPEKKKSTIFPKKKIEETINNKKNILSSKSAYYYDFWRSYDTEDWSNDAENTALITGINYINIVYL